LEPKKTALYDVHIQLGAKMVEFAGYWMPVQYKGVINEHKRVRSTVGIFDVSHMGEFFIQGEKAAEYLQKMTINDVTKMEKYRAQYTGMCNENGGMIDDMIVYCFGDYFMAIVNASNHEKDFKWMNEHLIPGAEIIDRSDEYTLFAVQGRKAEATLQKLTDLDLSVVKYYWFRETNLAGVDVIVLRTGYTGEEGFEVAVHVDYSEKVWNGILEAGKKFDIEPIGLGARDTFGNDIDETTNPIEAGLGWATKVDKGNFLGREAIMQVKEKGATRKLVGFEMKQRAVPRNGYKILKDGDEIGYVTSGTFSPSLEKGIGIGYVTVPFNEVGTSISIEIRGKGVEAEVVKTPFYQRPY